MAPSSTPAPQVNATAQNTRLDINQAIDRFKQFSDDAHVYRRGQLAWSFKLTVEILAAIDSILVSNPHLESELRSGAHQTGPLTDLLDLVSAPSEADYEISRRKVLAKLAQNPSPQATALEHIVGGDLQTEKSIGSALYRRLNDQYGKGEIFVSGTPSHARDCVPGREATVYSRFGNTFANGRFSTGSTEDKLRLIDGKDGHYQCADANCTNDPMEKRYFVLRAGPVP